MASKSSREEARARAAALRAEQARKEKQKKQLLAAVTALIVVALGVAIAFAVSSRPKGTDATGSGSGNPTAFLSTLDALPLAAFDAAGAPEQSNNISRMQTVPSGTPLMDGKKAKVIYVGAEFCPYCATERWAMAAALNRFGKFSGLAPTTSADNDGNIPTVTFKDATYTSDYVTLQAIETQDRVGNPLQSTPADVEALIKKYDPQGSIPFTYYGTRALIGSGVDVTLFTGGGATATVTPDQIVAAMKGGATPLGKAIMSNANLITAQICEQTGQQPANVCTTPGVKAAAAVLPK